MTVGKRVFWLIATLFATMVTRMDRDVGRIMALLKELSLENQTLVIFSSDNGPT